MITIYHNPKCSKSRECIAFIENSNQEFEVIKYLDTPFTYLQLKAILKKLKIKPIDLIRQNESVWTDQFANKNLTDKQLINTMVKFPILIQRPIAVNGKKAVIARPLEKIAAII